MAINYAEQVSIAIANVKLRDQLRDQSIRDTLTGLFNRRYLLESRRREFSRAARTGQHISLLSIDVGHFKKYNDNHGHDAGDTVLRAVGECLEKSFRNEDIPCRFGGEDVGIATFPECGDNPQAVIRAAGEALYRVKENGRNRVEASSLLGLSSSVSTPRSVLLQRALVEEFDFPGQSNEAA